ncbi:hypothetical protein [Actinokineospora sp. NPDC004072]
MLELHHRLLALAGRAPDAWLIIAREVLAEGDTERLAELIDALAPVLGDLPEHVFTTDSHPELDRIAVAAVATQPGTAACWGVTRGSGERVHLIQADDAVLPAITAAVQRALTDAGATPRVEVFGPTTALPAYHETALRSAVLLWSAAPARPVRVAPVFDGASPAGGPWFSPARELVVDADERQRLLDFLEGGELVLAADTPLPDVLSARRPDVVPADLRSDGAWVWSAASGYFLDRHRVAIDPGLAEHAAGAGAPADLSPLDRHRVRAALTPGTEGVPLWRAG